MNTDSSDAHHDLKNPDLGSDSNRDSNRDSNHHPNLISHRFEKSIVCV